MIETVHIENFKIFDNFTLNFNSDLNILVGNNETGKSTILEAISLALTKKLDGKQIDFELSSHLFNKGSTESYLRDCRSGKNPELPRILIELYFADRDDLQGLRGSNNFKREDSVGVKLEITFDEDYREECLKLLEDTSHLRSIPSEYYRVHWLSFADNPVTRRSMHVVSSHIDATTIRLQSGADFYLQSIINDRLDPKEKIAL